jgi:hypothetical protein
MKLRRPRACAGPLQETFAGRTNKLWASSSRQKQKLKIVIWDWKCSLMVKYLPSMHEALGFIFSTTEKKSKLIKNCNLQLHWYKERQGY